MVPDGARTPAAVSRPGAAWSAPTTPARSAAACSAWAWSAMLRMASSSAMQGVLALNCEAPAKPVAQYQVGSRQASFQPWADAAGASGFSCTATTTWPSAWRLNCAGPGSARSSAGPVASPSAPSACSFSIQPLCRNMPATRSANWRTGLSPVSWPCASNCSRGTRAADDCASSVSCSAMDCRPAGPASTCTWQSMRPCGCAAAAPATASSSAPAGSRNRLNESPPG